MNSIKHHKLATGNLQQAPTNPAIYNSNNQKMVEPLSNRAANAPNHAYFAASSNEQMQHQQATNGQAAILREMPITNNLQKSGGELHCKVDR